MPMDRFLIAPLNTGLETDLRPWLIPDDAFSQLNNAYVFRGRVRKRFGSRLMGNNATSSRLRILMGSTNGAGVINSTGNPFPAGTITKAGQQFSIGSTLFTVVDGTPGFHAMLRTDNTGENAQFNAAAGTYSITKVASPNTAVYFYPSEPVMGLANFESGAVNNHPSFGFDTRFAYAFSGGTWNRSGSGVTPIWHGSDTDFFWAANWTGIADNQLVLFVSNFYVRNPNGAKDSSDDPLWSYNNPANTWAKFGTAAITKFITSGGAGNYVFTARLVIPFKDRLLLLNTIERNNDDTANINYPQRCRFSHNGSPFASTAWLEPNQVSGGDPATGAGWIDATTDEEIVSAEFIKDRLIVYFERSTWELAYTGNEIQPFVWQKINTELGSEATFSSVPFDKVILTVGSTGIHACSGANVERIDNKIPNQVFQINNKVEGVSRVAGIRDYYTEMVYWTFPAGDENPSDKYPNRILVYNYKNGSWAFNDDSITMFGYFEQQDGQAWSTTMNQWSQANYAWNSGVTQAQFRQVIAGNQQGFVFIVAPDISSNAPVLQISNMTNTTNLVVIQCIDHNLDDGDYVKITGALDNNSASIALNGGIYQVWSVLDSNLFAIKNVNIGNNGYSGGGLLSRVSNIYIASKQWNPYVDQGRNLSIAKIDFCVLKTTNGQVTIDYSPSSANISMIEEGDESQAILGTSVLETSPYALIPLERVQNRLWHPVYLQTDGECIQIQIYMSDEQMTNPAISESDFQLEGLVLHTQPTAQRLS